MEDPKPFDPLTDDVPMPNAMSFDLDVLKDRLGVEVTEGVLLKSQVVALTQTCQLYQMQVAALRAKVQELTPKDEVPEIVSETPIPPTFLKSAEDLVDVRNGA